ncbi:MAG TPA: hypothetical protein ENO21_02215 [Firmicutes bacterium]|nr:hypothetical protein [Bacillota bacterium]
MEDVFIFIVLMVTVLVAGRIVMKAMDSRYKHQQSPKQALTKHDYAAWKEGQKAAERQTAKEIQLYKLKKAERDAARQTYERLVKEKLDVMRTALSMGMEKDALAELDTRLEKLIGQGKLERLLDEEIAVPEPTAELRDADLEAELLRLAELRKKHANL